MKTIQIVLDERLLAEIDRAARRDKQNRSELFREAVREHLQRRRIRQLERRHERGYERFPPEEFDGWSKVSAWPKN